jgi:hypothetical protein
MTKTRSQRAVDGGRKPETGNRRTETGTAVIDRRYSQGKFVFIRVIRVKDPLAAFHVVLLRAIPTYSDLIRPIQDPLPSTPGAKPQQPQYTSGQARSG